MPLMPVIERNGQKHRIRIGDKVSDWRRYDDIAILEQDGIIFISVTDYYDGYLPTNRIMICRPLETLVRELHEVH